MPIVCHVLRTNANCVWAELLKDSTIEVSGSGIIIRDASSYSLQADFPILSLRNIEILTETIAQIHSCDEVNKLAIRFNGQSDFKKFLSCLDQFQIIIFHANNLTDNLNSIFPNLKDASTQELILNVLFSEHFKGFVKDLRRLMDEVAENVTQADSL